MKFELKNVAFNERLSQETNAYFADVWVNGKKAGIAENSGRGEETTVSLHLLKAAERIAINKWVENQPEKVYPANGKIAEFRCEMTLAVICDDLLVAWVDAKRGPDVTLKRWCKTNIVFRLKSDKKDSYRKMKGKDKGVYTMRLKGFLVKQYGADLEEVVNERFGEKPQ